MPKTAAFFLPNADIRIGFSGFQSAGKLSPFEMNITSLPLWRPFAVYCRP
jgi:hypothetical protein